MKAWVRGSLACLILLAAFSAPAWAQTKSKFVLDWTVIGTHAPFSIALENKLFEKNGLSITIDRGYGSVDTINKVANGLYEFGFADPNLLVKYNHENPDAKVTMVLLLYDGSQSAIIARKAAGIATPKDLVGKKIGSPPSDNSRQMFPVYARAAGFDAAKIQWVSAQPQIKDTMLFRGDVDAVASLEPTSLLALKKLGANTNDFISMRYSAYLPELLGTGIIVSEKTIREKPDMIRAFVRAVTEGMKIAIARPKDSVATLVRLDPMVDLVNEFTRFQLGLDMSMVNPDLKSQGIGTVAPERLRKSMEYMAATFEVPMPADLKTIYNQDFLPPVAERTF